jgi:hypothetical protein
MKNLRNYLSPFQEIDLSSLLGITADEYGRLHHGPLYEYKNDNGDVIEFFMHIYPSNRQELLVKIPLDDCLIAIFQPEDIFALRRKRLPFSGAKKYKAVMDFQKSGAAL